MYSPEDILADREKRSEIIKKAASQSDLITVKANIPGADKRIKESFLLVRYFTNLALKEFNGKAEIYNGADGMCALITAYGGCLKERAIKIEQCDPLGRYVDIDAYLKGSAHSLSRGYMRKCFLCGEAAFICARLKTHSTEELLGSLKKNVRGYFSAHIEKTVRESLMAELNLEDKFGLVTPTSQGSHKDLDFGLMIKAQNAIIPFFPGFFWEGFDAEEADNLLEKLRPAGLEAEKNMYSAVGVNAYKGFIFVGGLLLASTGFLVSHGGGDFDEIFKIVQNICRGIKKELDGNGETFGVNAYKKYEITGVRGHAENGFYAVKNAEKSLDDLSPLNLKTVLCRIVGEIDDTVLLKRSGTLERYLHFKQKISSIDVYDKSAMDLLNRECIENGISLGGSADVLAAAVMLKKLRGLLYFN